jgi:dTDP-4-amino-4,6-dideoxygalactose transaminase
MQDAAARVLAEGSYILGPNVSAFEEECAAYLDSRHCVGVSSGTDALLLSLIALKRRYGDGEVVTSPFTFVATAEAVAMAGFKVVFADVEAATGLVDPACVASCCGSQTRGILPVHLFGQCADLRALGSLSSETGAWILEDVAQAMGARYAGSMAGSVGVAGCFSFFPSKTLGGAGDGGLICTGDESLARDLKAGRRHGASAQRYLHDFLAGNYRLDELQAAILRVKLKHLDRWNEARGQVGATYESLLKESGLLASGAVQLLERAHDSTHVFHQFVIRATRRDGLAEHLRSRGVQTAVYYPVPLHVQPAFRYLGYRPEDCPRAMALAAEVLALPIFPGLTRAEQEEVVAGISSFYSAG